MPSPNGPKSDTLLTQLLALHPKLIDLSLERMWRLLSALDHPQDKCPPIIHIAGTNGKGSTAAMLRAMLEADGKTVHAYHSPHLVHFHERILLRGSQVSETGLADVLARVEAANQGRPITFFEVTTAAAFLAFCESPADYLILEVGLGGRLDATNVVTPALSAITPVSLDHQDFLGDTLLSIAEEKAGIMKTGVRCILAPQAADVREHMELLARKCSAPLICAGQEFTAHAENGRLIFQYEAGLLDLPLPRLSGAHQIDNAGTALALAQQLGVSSTAMAQGLETVDWPARLQRLTKGPLVDRLSGLSPQSRLWLDGGHNEAAAHALAQWLKSQADTQPVHLIIGLLNTKAHEAYLAALAGTDAEVSFVPIPGNDNSLAPETLVESANRLKLHATAYPTIEKALDANSAPNALVLIAGSLYLAGHVLAENA